MVCRNVVPDWAMPSASAPGGPVSEKLAVAVPSYSLEVARLALMPRVVFDPRLIELLVPVLLPADMILVAFMSLVLGFLASLYPAWRVVKLSPLEALHK